ncbi:MAG: hypothetical protein ACYTGX_07350 [Planctomycetota bacterium]
MTPAIRWFLPACALLLGCGGDPAAPVAAPAPVSTAAPSAGPAAASAQAGAPAAPPVSAVPGNPAAAAKPAPAPPPATGLRADAALVKLIADRPIGRAPTVVDPFLPSMTRQFDPTPQGKWATDPRVQAEVRRLAAGLTATDREARADAAYALAELGPAVALYLDGAVTELRAAAVQRVDTMLAGVKQRLADAGLTPEQVVWDPKFGRYEPTVTTLVRDLIDGDDAQQTQAREALGEMDAAIVWMFHERPVRQILLEPARAALLATQRRIWRTADAGRAAEWLALRMGATLWVDKAILNETRTELRDRDYVDPELVFDNLTGELLADYTTYTRGSQRGYVVWRPAVPPAKPGEPARPIGAELAAATTTASAYRMIALAGDFPVQLGEGVDGATPAKFAIRTFNWVLLLFTLAEELGHEVEEHPAGGFRIVPKK